MSEIVVKLADDSGAATPAGVKVAATIRVQARTGEGQRKYAESWPEVGDGKGRSRWGILSLNGEAVDKPGRTPPAA